LSSICRWTSPFGAFVSWNGMNRLASSASRESNLRPIRRFTANTVFFGFVSAWRLAIWPTSLSPLAVNPTIEGVVRAPSWLGIT
jgi:hypothetical protein